jgi:hypothetical protein
MEYRSIAVTGATGHQVSKPYFKSSHFTDMRKGGSIVKHFAVTYPEISVRAITRDINKKAALDLLTLGSNVSLHQADFEDKDSLVTAFAGIDAIYLVTDYWNTQNNHISPNLNSEIMHGIAAIDAAAETKGLKHLLFGTLVEFASLSNMKWRNMYHFSVFKP